MNYETLIALALVLLIIISFCVHNTKEPLKNKKVTKPKKTNKHILTPIGKSFAEFIPPKTECDPEKGCHTGSYTVFNKNL